MKVLCKKDYYESYKENKWYNAYTDYEGDYFVYFEIIEDYPNDGNYFINNFKEYFYTEKEIRTLKIKQLDESIM